MSNKLTGLFRYCAVVAASVALLFVATPAASASSGTLTITSNTTLTEDHYGNILIHSVDNVTLDCAGHTVFGPGVTDFSGGIDIAFSSGVTVKGCVVSGFEFANGILAHHVPNLRLENNTLVGNCCHGAHIDTMEGGVVIGNTSRSNVGGIGIVLTRSTQSSITNNKVENNKNWAGIALFDDSHDNVVVNNTAIRNGIGFVLDNVVDNALRSNTANLNDAAGFLLIRDASDNVLESNTANQNLNGFEIVEGSNSNMISSNVANGNASDGFKIFRSDSNTFTGNIGNANRSHGFIIFGGVLDGVFVGSNSNTFTGNIGRGNRSVDAYDEGSGTGNVWTSNNFGTTIGIP